MTLSRTRGQPSVRLHYDALGQQPTCPVSRGHRVWLSRCGTMLLCGGCDRGFYLDELLALNPSERAIDLAREIRDQFASSRARSRRR